MRPDFESWESPANLSSPIFATKASRFLVLRICLAFGCTVLATLCSAQTAPSMVPVNTADSVGPLCEKEFVAQVHKEMNESPAERPRLMAYLRGVELARKSVRRIDCMGIGEATF